MKKMILSILIVVFSSFAFYAQTSYQLTLEECIEIAKKKSYRMLQLEQDFKIAQYNLKWATSRLKTHIDLSLNIPQYTKGIGEYTDTLGRISSYYSVEGLKSSGVLDIYQPLLTDGQIYIQNSFSGTNDISNKQYYAGLETRVGFSQPLNAFYGYNAIKSDLKRAKLAYEQSSKALKREELDLVYLVSNSYYTSLSSQKSAEIAMLDLERQNEAFEISQNKYKAGLIKEVDALQMEVDLAEAQNSYDIAIQSQIASVNSLKEILGVDLHDSITLSSDLHYEAVVVNTDFAVELALKNRLEIREQEIQIEQQKLTIQQQKAAGMIRSSIDAYIGKLGVGGLNNASYSSAFQNSYNDYFDRPLTYGIGLTIRIPILDWGENKALVRAAEARLTSYNYSKNEIERSIETEVCNLVASLNSNLKRLQSLEKNLVVAEKSFEITRQRYSDGDIDSQVLALERNRLNTAYRNHLGAYINYQLSLADLMRKTFYDFRQDTPIQ